MARPSAHIMRTILNERIERETELIRDYLANIRDIHSAEYARINELANQPDRPDEADDWASEDRYEADKLLSVMYASLAVTIFAFAENTLASINHELDIKYETKKGRPVKRPDWGLRKDAFVKKCSVNCSKWPEFKSVDRARILANCFKHNHGRKNDEAVKMLKGKFGDEIAYMDQDWKAVLQDVSTFLIRAADKVCDSSRETRETSDSPQ